jgi:hypothetical protein
MIPPKKLESGKKIDLDPLFIWTYIIENCLDEEEEVDNNSSIDKDEISEEDKDVNGNASSFPTMSN